MRRWLGPGLAIVAIGGCYAALLGWLVGAWWVP